MSEFNDLIQEFVTEASEHLADIEEDLIKIEADRENIEQEVINRVFRAAHSIKGSAKFLDLHNIGNLAHRMEDVLNLIRNGKLIPDNEVMTTLLDASDMLKTMFDDVMSSNNQDITPHLQRLQAILDGKNTHGKDTRQETNDILSINDIPGFDLDKKAIETALRSGSLYHITLDMEEACEKKGRSPLKLVEELGELGKIMDCFIDLDEVTDSSLTVHILYSSIIEKDLLPDALGIDPGSVAEIKQEKQAGQMGETSTPAQHHGQEKSALSMSDTGQEAISHAKALYDEGPEQEERQRPEGPMEFITFQLSKEVYAIPIHMIEEIIGLQDITVLPNVPGYVKGVINLRGEIVPVIDMRLKFGLEHMPYTQFTVFLITKVQGRTIGLVVDRVLDILVINQANIQQTPTFPNNIPTEFIEGMYRDEQNQMVILIDIESLIQPEEWMAKDSQTTETELYSPLQRS